MKLMFQTVVVRSYASLSNTEEDTTHHHQLARADPMQPLSIMVNPTEEARLRSPSLSPTGTIRFDTTHIAAVIYLARIFYFNCMAKLFVIASKTGVFIF